MVFLDLMYEVAVNALEDNGDMSCDSGMNMKFDEKLYSVATPDLEKHFNCTIPFLPEIVSNTTGKPAEICNNSSIGSEAVKYYRHLRDHGPTGSKNFPCATMDIYLGVPFIAKDGEKDKAYTKLYLKSKIRVKTTALAYDGLTLLAELGGYTGLLLGLSGVGLTFLLNSVLVQEVTKRYSIEKNYERK